MLTIKPDLDPTDQALPEPDAEPSHPTNAPAPLVQGSITAQALVSVWRGSPATIVDSPPGAGKSTLVANIVAHLSTRSDIKTVVATPTRRQAYDIAVRISELVPPGSVSLRVTDIHRDFDVPSAILHPGSDQKSGQDANIVTVRTLSSCVASAPTTDLFIVDEAYQSKFAHALFALDNAQQVLMVGDPGQIGPVTTINTAHWDGSVSGPHVRAPEGFARRDDVTTFNLDTSYRLGQDTVDAIAPLYDFEFSSSRPERRLIGRNEIESLRVPTVDGPQDMALLTRVAQTAVDMVGGRIDTDTGSPTTVTAGDIAVVVSHNSQSSGVSGVLASMGYDDITVGTADKMQGGQWHCVVSLDPFIGKDTLSPHALSLGRLCVMASRHRTHLTWVHDGRWADSLTNAELPKPDVFRHRAVREALCGP